MSKKGAVFRMKLGLVLLLVVLLGVVAAACGISPDTQNASSSEGNSSLGKIVLEVDTIT